MAELPPYAIDDQVRRWARAERVWRQRLRSGVIDPSGPFASTPLVTERSWFREVAESSWPAPQKEGLLRWSFRLADGRVNAAWMALIESSYRVETHTISFPEPVRLTGQQLVSLTLTDAPRRTVWHDGWAEVASRTREASLGWWERRIELARRAGLGHLDGLESACVDPLSLARSVLERTNPHYASFELSDRAAYFEAALGVSASEGWPSRLSLRSLIGLLGSEDLLAGVAPELGPLPQPVAPASFLRGLLRLGSSLMRAYAPTNQPFAVASDPGGLSPHLLGALLGSLPTRACWQLRVGGVSGRKRAQDRARQLTVVQLLHLRWMALGVILRHHVLAGSSSLLEEGGDDVERALGFPWPRSLTGVSPRLLPHASQRLLGPLLAEELHDELVQRFDEDWFRNPRALEELRHRFAAPQPHRVAAEPLEQALRVALESLESRLV
jgi:hypothetical protein